MEQQQVAESEASLAVDVKAEETQAEPEPQLDAAVGSPTDDASKSKKKKKKKKKNRRKSLEKVEMEELTADKSDPEEEEPKNQEETAATDESTVVEETTVSEGTTVTNKSVVGNEFTAKSTVAEESTVETTVDSTVTEQNTETTTVESTVTKETTVECTLNDETVATENSTAAEETTVTTESNGESTESTVTTDTTVPSTVTEEASIEKKTVDEDHEASNQEHEAEEDLSPPNLERATSLDTLKATGTKAVGSLFSKFKMGRKKPLPSRTDSATQLELVAPSPVKTAVKKLEISEEKSLDDLLMRTKRDFFGEGEQSVHVSTERDKYDSLETQRKADEAAIAARRTPPSSTRSSAEVQAQLEAVKEQIEASSSTTVTAETESTVAVSSGAENIVEEADELTVPVIPVDTTESTDTTTVDNGTAITSVPETTATDVDHHSADTTTKPASLELELDLEPRSDVESDVVSHEKAELLSVKITPPTTELPADTTARAKPEKMSPVKSLASRFEGKREQSLDSLKFRTVREFFPTERSIRVGAEKQKYEAQAQQQQLKAKAEEEAKSKYKIAVKSPESVTIAAATDTDGFTTPDTASTRKKMSFDDGYSSANSPGKVSDEALTPVKSIASRFEGKREESLDSLKFRTVREFFPEQRSVRVGSEKQKFEAQAQQDNSLDKLKFRTVREFFPEEGERSVRVGAEKAKFEAIAKQQEEAKAAEQLNLKHVASPTTQKSDSTQVEAVIETSSSAVESQDETVTSAATELEGEDDGASVIENTVAVEAHQSTVTESEPATVVEASAKEEESENVSPSVDADAAVVNNEDTSALSTENHENDVKSAEPTSDDVAVNEEVEELSEEPQSSIEEAETEQREENAVVAEDNTNQEEVADAGTVEPVHDEQVSADVKQIENQEPSNDVQATDEPVKLDLEESVVVEAESSVDAGVSEQVNVVGAEKHHETVEITAEEATTSELVELDLGDQVQDIEVTATSEIATEANSLDVQQIVQAQGTVEESQLQVEKSAPSADNGVVELDLDESVAEPPKVHSSQGPNSKCPILTTERSFVMQKDDTIETEDTVVVGERPMTDGEDEFEPLSPAESRPAHELFAGIPPKKELKKKKSAPKLTRKVSVGSVGSAKSSSSKTTVPVPMKRASITAPTASYTAKKAAEAEQHKASQLKKQGSASKLKGTGASPTVPIPMKRASITAPTASYTARKAAEEEAHRTSKPHKATPRQRGTVSETGFVKPPPAAPTVPVPMKRASITAPTASWQARNVPAQSSDHALKPTSTGTQSARSKRYANVKSKVLDGLQTGTTRAVAHKKITKEEFIAAERRKSLGSAGVRSVLDAVDRRASLTARAAIVGPPEPFIRSALSRKKLNSTVPRYLDYENTPGYAERARKQYERRKRLEDENAAKSEKRQRELRVFFTERQQKSMMSSAEEVGRGLEAHEFAQLAKESDLEAQKALRRGKPVTRPTRTPQRALSTTSASSSSVVASRTSKKSTVSSASVEDKIVAIPALDLAVVETEEGIESTVAESVEVTEEIVTEQQVEAQTSSVPVVDDDPELKNVAKKIDFDQTSSDSEKIE